MTTRRRKTTTCGMALLFAIGLAACGSSADDDAQAVSDVAIEAEDESSDGGSETETDEAGDEAVDSDSAEADEGLEDAADDDESGPQGPAVFEPDATQLTLEFEALEEDTYRVDTLGTPLTVTVDRPLQVQPNSDGFFVLTRVGSVGPDDDDIVFMRLSGLSDPAAPNTDFESIEGGWSPNDFAGWAANLADGITVSEPEETMLGGSAAIRVDLEVGDIECAIGPVACVSFGTDHLAVAKFLNPEAAYRIWVVDQGEEAPIAVVVGTTEPDGEWLATAEEVLATVAFGDAAPGPMSTIQAGQHELAFFDGVRVETDTELVVMKSTSGRDRLFSEIQPADIEFLTRPVDGEGVVLETADELVEVLVAGGVEVEEVGPAVVGGIDARIVTVADVEPAGPAFFLGEGGSNPWFAPPLGQMWLIEHPDRGLLVINAEAFFDDAAVLQTITGQAEQIASTLDFIG